MRQYVTLSAGLALCMSACAQAGFVGWAHEFIDLGNGHSITNIYATFDSPADRLLGVTNARAATSSASGFVQSVANPYWRPAASQSFLSDDSFVCIGTNASNMASSVSTAGGESFLNFDDSTGATDFSVMSWSGDGASWYNPSPGTNNYGVPINNRVMVAHLTITFPFPETWIQYNFTAVVQLANGQQVLVGEGDHILYPGLVPGPGPLVAFALAGRRGRRRRRA